ADEAVVGEGEVQGSQERAGGDEDQADEPRDEEAVGGEVLTFFSSALGPFPYGPRCVRRYRGRGLLLEEGTHGAPPPRGGAAGGRAGRDVPGLMVRGPPISRGGAGADVCA